MTIWGRHTGKLVILLNPYNVDSPEYTSSVNREEYVERALIT